MSKTSSSSSSGGVGFYGLLTIVFIVLRREQDSMKIAEMMQVEGNHLRITSGDRWLIGEPGQWTVYQHLYGARKTTIIIQTDDEDAAVEALLYTCPICGRVDPDHERDFRHRLLAAPAPSQGGAE